MVGGLNSLNLNISNSETHPLGKSQNPGTAWLSYTHLHTVLVHGTLEALFLKKGSLYESYVLNPPAVN